MAALIARLLRKKAAANVAAKNVGKVRMMTPGEMIRIRFRISAGNGGEIGFRIDAPSISTWVTKKVAIIQQMVLCGIDATPCCKNKNASS